MSKKDRKKKKVPLDAHAEGFEHNPFAAAFGAPVEETDLAGDTEAQLPSNMTHDTHVDLGEVAKVVLRMERKGRGGRTVTLVEGMEDQDPAALEGTTKLVKKMLGAGAVLEDGKIVVQGDQRDRLQVWLRAQGVSKVVISGA